MDEDLLALLCAHLLFAFIIFLFRLQAQKRDEGTVVYSVMPGLPGMTVLITLLVLINLFGT